ncbi:MAG: NAD(P)-binding domain-containing protein [Rhodobacteraceae bacterium]|nr:NAD(P)-binding domain-containing protein [Paracoccaceae bacterium]
MKIGFIGTGRIAEACVRGLAGKGHDIYITERSALSQNIWLQLSLRCRCCRFNRSLTCQKLSASPSRRVSLNRF